MPSCEGWRPTLEREMPSCEGWHPTLERKSVSCARREVPPESFLPSCAGSARPLERKNPSCEITVGSQLGKILSAMGHNPAQVVLFLSRVGHHPAQLGLFLSDPQGRPAQVGIFLSGPSSNVAQFADYLSRARVAPSQAGPPRVTLVPCRPSGRSRQLAVRPTGPHGRHGDGARPSGFTPSLRSLSKRSLLALAHRLTRTRAYASCA